MSEGRQAAARVSDPTATEPPWGVAAADDLPVPEPAADEVLVRVLAAPVHSFDNYLLYPKEYVGEVPIPSVPGLEGMGVVKALGSDVSNFSLGQRVALCCMPIAKGRGSWQRYVALPEASLMPLPDAVPDDAAAQAYINPVTAYQLIEELHLPADSWLLQSAASSAVGKLLVQIARHKGIKTINVVRNMDSEQELRKLGADDIIVTKDGADIAAKVREITAGRLAYAALDAVAGATTGQLLQAVGTLIVYGLLSSTTVQTDVADLLFRGKVVRGFGMRGWWEQQSREKQKRVFAQVLQWLADGVIRLAAGQKFSLDRIEEAVMLTHTSRRGPKPLLVFD